MIQSPKIHWASQVFEHLDVSNIGGSPVYFSGVASLRTQDAHGSVPPKEVAVSTAWFKSQLHGSSVYC